MTDRSVINNSIIQKSGFFNKKIFFHCWFWAEELKKKSPWCISQTMETKRNHPETLNDLLEESVKTFSTRPALGFFNDVPISYGDMFQKVISVSDLLQKKGVSPGDRVAILGENSPNWGISYFAIIRIGAVAVPILPDFPEADIRHILADSEAKILFTTEKQLQKVGDLSPSRLRHIITLDDFQSDDQLLEVQPFSSVVEMALGFLKKIPVSIGLKSNRVSGDDLASIIYTSGTSGHSKAVMLTHKNFLSNVKTMATLIDIDSSWTFLSILTLSHSFEFTVGFLLALLHGARTVYLNASPTPTLLEKACKVERPQAICAVPLILEKIYKRKVRPVLERSRAMRMITRVPGLRRAVYRKINRKLIGFFGGKLAVMAIGGAPFNVEAETFFRKSGFPYLVGYGLTETSPLLAGGPFGDRTIRVSSTGKPISGVEIKIDHPDPETGIGEILARGPNVMKGYYKNPELTREIIDGEGWLDTGDLGFIDNLNNLTITGRSKNMILMSNGENIYPETIEEKINAAPLVMESLVLENNNRLEAWVVPDYDLVDQETRGKSEKQKREFIDAMLDRLKRDVNARLSSFSKISKMVERQEPFEKTATMKIKRYLYTRS